MRRVFMWSVGAGRTRHTARRAVAVASVLAVAGLYGMSTPVGAASAGSSSAAVSVKHGTTGPAHHAQAQLSSSPSPLTPAQRHRLEARPRLTPKQSQGGGAATKAPSREQLPPQTVGGPVRSSQTRQQASPAASTDFEAYRFTDLSGISPGNVDSTDEPSVSNDGYAVFYTGNWYAALSSNSGHSFSFIDPFKFGGAPGAPNGGFCCDQVTLHDSAHDLTAWELLYCNKIDCSNGNGDNVIRFAFANSQDNLAAGSFYFYDFNAQSDFGFPEGDWIDYPQLAFGTNEFYVTMNIYDSSENFIDSLIVRMPTSALVTGSGFSYQYYSNNQDFTWSPTVTAPQTTLYWGATGYGTNNFLRVYRWTEGSSNVAWNDFSPSFTAAKKGQASCPAPDATDWCSFDDSRVQGAWRNGNEVGFTWDAKQDGTFAYPYVYVAIFDVSGGTPTFTSHPIIFNSSYAWAYPGAGIDPAGDLGISLAIGGGTWGYPGSQFILRDSVTPNPWTAYGLENGAHAASRWGDYLTSHPAGYPFGDGDTFVATGFTEQDDGFGNAYVLPRMYWLGRQSNDPFVPTEFGTYSNSFTEGAFKTVKNSLFYGPSNCTCDYFGTDFWGDGGATGSIIAKALIDGPNYFYTKGTYAYAEEGSYSPSAVINDLWGYNSAGSGGTSTVADAKLTASAVNIKPVEGKSFSGTVATFTDADPAGTTSDYTATVNWGDGTGTHSATVGTKTGGFKVTGSHTYAEEGTFNVKVTIQDVGGAKATTTGTATVADAALTSSGKTFSGIAHQSLTKVVASFTDADPGCAVGDYTATIKWGDGSGTSAGTIVTNGSTCGFNVKGTHTYASSGTFTVKVTIVDHTATTVATSTANISAAADLPMGFRMG
jgi:hypothetical protein